MSERIEQRSLIGEALSLYTGGWKLQSIIYLSTLMIALAVSLIADLGLKSSAASVGPFSVSLVIVLLFLIPVVYVAFRGLSGQAKKFSELSHEAAMTSGFDEFFMNILSGKMRPPDLPGNFEPHPALMGVRHFSPSEQAQFWRRLVRVSVDSLPDEKARIVESWAEGQSLVEIARGTRVPLRVVLQTLKEFQESVVRQSWIVEPYGIDGRRNPESKRRDSTESRIADAQQPAWETLLWETLRSSDFEHSRPS